MVGHYVRKWSPAARWCERLAAIAIPYFAIAIALHRVDRISTPQVYWLIAFGLLLLAGSLLFGLRAFFDLWSSGRRGGKAALRGMAVSLIILGPFLWYGYLGLTRPPVNDVSTNPVTPPPFEQLGRLRQAYASEGINPLAEYTPGYAGLLSDSYPRLASRRYNSGVDRIYNAVTALIEDRGWALAAVRGAEQPSGEEEEGEETEPFPSAAATDVEVEAVARSLVFGYRQDLAIAIIAEAESTLVDMRASTRWGAHDFGRNADTIIRFLSDLDKALIGIAGEG